MARYREAVEMHGLNEPILVQFTIFFKNLMSGNWGTSWSIASDVDVSVLIRHTIPTSIELLIISGTISYFLGKHLGINSVTGKNKIISNFLRIIMNFGSSIPNFVLGLIIIRFFLYEFNIEITNYKSFGAPDPPLITGMRLTDCLISGQFDLFLDTIKHYIVPIILLCFQFTILISKQVRSIMKDIMGQDYIRTARAKGCTENTVIQKHAYRVGLIQIINVILANYPNMLSNLLLIETVFKLPGFCPLIVMSIIWLDYNVMIISVSILVISVVSINLIADILYIVLDPRIRYN
jgi:peptide/nickel transport system permease protein